MGASSITVAALNGWPTGTAVHFVIYTTTTTGTKVAGSQTDWKGVVSGTTITNLQIRAGTDTIYPIGATVVCTPTAAWDNDIVQGILAHANQNGSLIPSVVTTALTGTTLPANTVATTSITDGSITTAKLNLSKTTDANGWTIYDYGNWKEYLKTFGPYTQAANAGLLNERYSLATGLTGPVAITTGTTAVTVVATTTAGDEFDRIVPSANTYTTTTFNLNITISKPSTANSTYTGIMVTVRMITK